ncbi:hypothetical protein QQF64_036065 [Cirrhinus molitorella]|uniref:Uncharacterized protein n=1 Tax=Cirrhinus molitorella TaxID=172907 RepID=A0ABR3NHV4_9TELE
MIINGSRSDPRRMSNIINGSRSDPRRMNRFIGGYVWEAARLEVEADGTDESFPDKSQGMGTKKSRNQAKVFDNSALLVEKLKALGYFPLLLWGKYIPHNQKWRAQLQCPFELPVAAHAVLEKIACLFEACEPEREEEVGQQERTGEEDEAAAEIDDEDQNEQGEQQKMGETGRWDMQEMEVDAQEDTVDGERVEREEVEGQKELGVVETAE